jgi:hypothetical protein
MTTKKRTIRIPKGAQWITVSEVRWNIKKQSSVYWPITYLLYYGIRWGCVFKPPTSQNLKAGTSYKWCSETTTCYINWGRDNDEAMRCLARILRQEIKITEKLL